jgi:hypothetical protein
MKNWKQSVFFGMVAIIALSFGFIGCDEKTPDPEPVPKTRSFNANIEGVTVTVNFMAVTDDDPLWWDKLVEAVQPLGAGIGLGNHTLTVTSTGASSFVVGVDGKATVSAEFLVKNNVPDIRNGLGPVLADWRH